jgi:hypothetical protein
MNTSLLLQLFKDTLLLIPCSGAKQPGSKPSNALSILSVLDPARANALKDARAKLGEKIKEGKKPKEAPVDEKTLMPAYLRYSGQLYEHGCTSIGGAVAAGQRILIVSGGYGLLLADEPIGIYNKRFTLSDWPGDLLEGCILDYARHNGIRSIIAVMSRTTDYAKLIRRVNWSKAGLEASLVSPVSHGDGALRKVPCAQGQAVAALINTGLDQAWRSSDSLSLKTENL